MRYYEEEPYRRYEEPYRRYDEDPERRRRREEFYEGRRGEWERPEARGRGEERGFWDRAGDEVRSWLGDEEASRRRRREEREPGGYERGAGPEPDVRDERDWARRWGYVEGRADPRGRWRSPGPAAERDWEYGERGRGWGGESRWMERPRPRSGEGWTEGFGPWPGGGITGIRRQNFAGLGPRGYQRSDEKIKDEVCEILARDPDLDASAMEVEVTNGEVTLRGEVRERADKRLAEDLAESVWGVKEVHNLLRVQSGGQRLPEAA